jgi:hypothetical protein
MQKNEMPQMDTDEHRYAKKTTTEQPNSLTDRKQPRKTRRGLRPQPNRENHERHETHEKNEVTKQTDGREH